MTRPSLQGLPGVGESTPPAAAVQEFAVTFGLKYHGRVGDTVHPMWPEADSCGWVTVVAPDEDAAREIVWRHVGSDWAFIYPAAEFDRSPHPKGELARWSE